MYYKAVPGNCLSVFSFRVKNEERAFSPLPVQRQFNPDPDV